jgi:hypothetical protein
VRKLGFQVTHPLKAPGFKTLEPIKVRKLDSSLCFQMGQLVPLPHGALSVEFAGGPRVPHAFGRTVGIMGLWFMVYGLWFLVYGLWFMVYGLWFMVYGLWFMVYDLC